MQIPCVYLPGPAPAVTVWNTDGQLGTRDGSSGRPGALLKIFFPTQNSSTPYLTYIHCFLWLGKMNIADTTTGDTIRVWGERGAIYGVGPRAKLGEGWDQHYAGWGSWLAALDQRVRGFAFMHQRPQPQAKILHLNTPSLIIMYFTILN